MVLWLRRCALLLWTLSWISPTVRSASGELLPGFLLVGQAIGALVVFLPFAWLVLPQVACLFTNTLFLRELGVLSHHRERHGEPPSPLWPALALVVNLAVPLTFANARSDAPLGLTGLTSLPGYPLWLASFGVLLLAALMERPDVRRMLRPVALRLVLMAAVAILVVLAAGAAALLLKPSAAAALSAAL